ncbi:MAG: hypothetical protein R3D55_11290 [Chloroflexota bacterium]
MQNSPSKEESHELNEPTLNILEEGLLHKIMLFFHLPTRLPGVFVALLALVLAGLTGAGWWLFTGDWRLAQWVGGLMALFMAADMALLLLLPRQKVSFGPWKAQLFALALPRVAAALGVALAARLPLGEWPYGFWRDAGFGNGPLSCVGTLSNRSNWNSTGCDDLYRSFTC